MKRFRSIACVLCLLLSLAAYAPSQSSAQAQMFDSGVSKPAGALRGNKADLIQLNGGSLNRGYFEGRSQITFWPEGGGDREAFADDLGSLVPAGGAVVYAGQTSESEYGWMLQKIGEMPVILPITEWDAAFYADEEFIWYYTDASGEEHTVGRVGYDGENNQILYRVAGKVVSMMPDDQVLVFSQQQNQVQLWKDGTYQTVYSPEEAIKDVFSLGRGIWVEFEGRYLRLSDGTPSAPMEGNVVATASSADHIALLVSEDAEPEYLSIMLFNELYQAYAQVGSVRRQANMFIELQPDQMIVWGAEDSIPYEYPAPEKWQPYGYEN